MINVYFYSDFNIFSLIVMLFSKSTFSHVAIGVNGIIYESSLYDGVTCSKDVRKYRKKYSITGLNVTAIESFLKNQLGKKYDKLAIFSFIVKENWEESNKWFCSELVARALKIGGFEFFKDKVSKITPGRLEKILNITHEIFK